MNSLIYVWYVKAKSVFKSKSPRDYFSYVNTEGIYSKLSVAAEPFLFRFSSSYMVEASFSHADTMLIKQRNRLNFGECDDLRPKLFNFRLNINNLATACQTPPSYSWCQIIQWQGILIYFKVFIIIYYYLYYLRCFFFVVVVVLLILFAQSTKDKWKKQK